MIIGITGTYRAGKGTISEHLVSKRNFKHYSSSKYIEEYLVKKGLTKIDRDAMIAGGNEIREKFGPDFIVRELYKMAQTEGGNIIIESIRNVREAEFIKSQPDSFLFAVDADPLKRFNRAAMLGGIKDRRDFNEFLASELKEFSSTNPNEQNLGKCIEMADYKFMNNENPEAMFAEVDKTLAEIYRGGKERRY